MTVNPSFRYRAMLMVNPCHAPLWHDVCLADNSGRAHAQSLKDSLLQEISVKLPRDAMNHDSQEYISGIAVAPLLARLKIHLHLRKGWYQLFFRIVLSKVNHSLTH